MVFRYMFLLLYGVLCMGCAAQEKVKHEASKISNVPFYHWNEPIVQDVGVPAHIENGVFIPEHKELVLIKPGQWAKAGAYPIATQKESYEKPSENINVDDVSDITSVPRSMGE